MQTLKWHGNSSTDTEPAPRVARQHVTDNVSQFDGPFRYTPSGRRPYRQSDVGGQRALVDVGERFVGAPALDVLVAFGGRPAARVVLLR